MAGENFNEAGDLRSIRESVATLAAGAPATAGATAAKQDTQITAEQAILAKLSADPATQTTLAAVLAKIIAAPATEATLALLATALQLPPARGQQTAGNSLSIIPANAASLVPAMATYRAIIPSYAAYVTPTDMLQITGSATKTVIVTGLWFAPRATVATVADIYFIKRSAVDTGMTVTAATPFPLDSTSGAATAVVNAHTAAPAGLGTAAGTIDLISNGVIAAATSAPTRQGIHTGGWPLPSFNVMDFRRGFILRGVAESICINLNGAPLPAGFTSSAGAEWIEL